MPGRAYRGLHPAFLVVIFVFGFLVATGYVQERARERELPARRQELQQLVTLRERTIAQLSREVAGLSERLARISEEAARGSADVQAAIGRVSALERAAGLSAMRGPGVAVQVSDSGRERATREDISDLRIQDLDLQLVVNALWQAGAEAVAVNGRRVATTTAIRTAGSTILVNYRAVGSPYRVVAIGDAEALARRMLASEIAERFEVWRQVYGLGFEVTAHQELAVPALRGLQGLRWAQPGGGMRAR